MAGYPVIVSIPASIIVTILLLSIVGSVAAIAVELDAKKKAIELAVAGLFMTALAFLVGKLASFLTAMI